MDPRLSERLKREIERERERSGAPDGFPAFPDIPAARYTDPDLFELERERVFGRSWLMAAHADEIPDPGSYVLWEDAGRQIVIVRGNDRRVRAFYNTCQHRGAPVVREASGRSPTLRCRYHSWTYDLEGNLVGVPDETDFVGLDRSCRALVPARCETWGGWIFVNRDPDAAPLLDSIAPVPDEMVDFAPEKLRLLDKHGFTLSCNWKVAMEANLEVYHLKHIHPHTVDRLLDHRATAIGLLPGGHSRMVSAKRPESVDGGFAGPGIADIATVGELPRVTNLSYHVFPNLVTPLDVTGFPFLLFWPIDVRTTRLEVLWFVADWGAGEPPELWKTFLALFDGVLEEDTANLSWIQRSVESEGFRGVPLSYAERRIYHFHEALDRAIGAEDVPPALRVAPRLAEHVER